MSYEFNLDKILFAISEQVKNFFPYDFTEKLIMCAAAIVIVFGISKLLEKED